MPHNPGLYRRDSIGKCENPHDLYSAVRNPNAAPPRVEAKTLDVVETEQERLERQALLRFREGHFRFMQQDGSALKLFTLLGKYGFVLITLPPYILLYTIPEWILMSMLPNIFKKGKKAFQAIPEWLSRAVAWVPSPSEILSKLIKPFSIAKQNLQDFLTMMKHSTQAVRSAIAYGLKESMLFLLQPFFKAAEMARDTYNLMAKGVESLAQAIQNAGQAVRLKVNEMAAVVEKGWNQVATYVKQIAQPAIDWSAQKIDFFNQVVRQGVNWVGATAYAAAEKVKEKLMPPITKAAELAHQAAQWTKQLAKPVIDWINPNLAWLADKSQQILDKTGKYFGNKIKDASEIASTVFHRSVDFAKAIAPIAMQFFTDTTQLMINLMIPAPIRRWYKAFRGGKSVKSFFGAVAEGTVTAAKQAFYAMGKKAAKGAAKMLVLVKQGLSSFAKFMKKLPGMIAKGAVATVKASLRGGRHFLHFLRLLLAWIRVLYRLGIQLLRELVAEIGGWVANDTR